ncbi:MAG: outer membrane protein assembly factor BamA [Ignavibacteria bacterium]|nr:outer membrane protein assembly factor BamA [Ignavibacteria bacterium]
MRFISGSLPLIIILFSVVAAPSQQAQRYPVIAGISVDGLTQGEDMQTVIAYSGLRVGAEARPEELVNAIKNLWNRRTFSDVRIERERETALGVFILIKVTPAPRLRNIGIVGNDALSAEEIMKAADKRNGDIIGAYELYQVRSAVKNAYTKEGKLFAKVETELSSADSANFYDLMVKVTEGVEYSVGSIEFEGNVLFSDKDLASAFEETSTRSWYEFWSSNDFDLEKYKKDLDKLREWFLEHGLLDAEIVDDTVIYNEANEKVNIRITVNEGKPIYIRKVKFIGNTVYPEDVLLARLDIVEGELYNQKKITANLTVNEAQTDATSLYADHGYLSASLAPELIRIGTDSVDITIKVIEGDRYTIRKVEVAGNTKTRDRVIRRELYTRPGDYFNRSAVIRSLRGLGVLNFFNPESLKPDVLPADKTKVDLVYKVEERSTDTFNASVGFAGAFGLTGSIGVTLNNFDISEPLRGGAGQILSFQWEFGQQSRVRTFQISFTEPWLFGQPTTVGFNIFDTRQNYNISIRRTGAQLNIGRRFRFPDDFFRGDWSVSFERQESNTSSIFYRRGVYTAFTLSQTISRTSYDNLIFPTSGSRLSLSLRGTTAFLGIGTTDFGKVGFYFDMVNPLLSIHGNPRLVMLVGSELGYVDGLKSDTLIPPQELYYMGGNGLGGFAITPLRGYRDNSIGPLAPNGRNLGGRILARFLTEVRFAVSLNPFPIYLLSFAEAGNVWANIRTVDPFGLYRAAGFGLRLLLNPIGLIGFDVGYGFDPDPLTGQRSGWRFHFQFGR